MANENLEEILEKVEENSSDKAVSSNTNARRKRVIVHNKIKCLKCGDIIESTSVHNYVQCSCGACAVDGGHEYLRRCGNMEDYEDLSETKLSD